MKKILFVLLILVLMTTSCTVQDSGYKKITVIFEDNEADMILKPGVGCVLLTDMVDKLEVENLENHVFELVGDRPSTITYTELAAGCYDEATGRLVFEELMCECADIEDLNTIKIKKGIKITNGVNEWFARIDTKQFIEGYITDTPEAYAYKVGEENFTFDTIPENALLIEMLKPEDSIEFKLRGDNPTSLFTEGTLREIARSFLANENDYVYFIEGEELRFNDLPAHADYVEFARIRIYVKRGVATDSKVVSIHQDTALKSITSARDPEEYDYKLTSSGGFSPPALSWEDFQTGTWLAEDQVTSFDSITSKKYSIRDLMTIELVEPSEETHEENEILIADHVDDLETVEINNHEGVLLAGFISIENPEAHAYKLIASDGYSPEAYTWEDMNKGYWLLDIEETFFPDKNLGTNRIRDLEKIVILS